MRLQPGSCWVFGTHQTHLPRHSPIDVTSLVKSRRRAQPPSGAAYCTLGRRLSYLPGRHQCPACRSCLTTTIIILHYDWCTPSPLVRLPLYGVRRSSTISQPYGIVTETDARTSIDPTSNNFWPHSESRCVDATALHQPDTFLAWKPGLSC